MKDNNYLAMFSLHAKQTEIWLETLLLDLKGKNLTSQFKSNIIAVRNSITRFNKSIESNLDKESHYEHSANISKLCEMLANSSKEEGSKIIECIKYLADNSEVINSKDDIELQEKLSLISEISEKLMKVKSLDLRKFHKQIINLPIKK